MASDCHQKCFFCDGRDKLRLQGPCGACLEIGFSWTVSVYIPKNKSKYVHLALKGTATQVERDTWQTPEKPDGTFAQLLHLGMMDRKGKKKKVDKQASPEKITTFSLEPTLDTLALALPSLTFPEDPQFFRTFPKIVGVEAEMAYGQPMMRVNFACNVEEDDIQLWVIESWRFPAMQLVGGPGWLFGLACMYPDKFSSWDDVVKAREWIGYYVTTKQVMENKTYEKELKDCQEAAQVTLDAIKDKEEDTEFYSKIPNERWKKDIYDFEYYPLTEEEKKEINELLTKDENVECIFSSISDVI